MAFSRVGESYADAAAGASAAATGGPPSAEVFDVRRP
jgi:hypothetical protein